LHLCGDRANWPRMPAVTFAVWKRWDPPRPCLTWLKVKNPESSAALRVWEARFYRWRWNFFAHEHLRCA
jgi:hypothetical protein